MRKAAIRTKGQSGPSGLDTIRWRRMLISKVFESWTSDLHIASANFIKHICINETEFQNGTTSLETFIASRLVPLGKNPGLWTINVGEVLRRIARKVIMSVVKDDVKKAVGIYSYVVGKMYHVRLSTFHAWHIWNKQDRSSFTCWC